MGEITELIEKHSGGVCYQTTRFTLDHFIPPEYQDKDEVFDSSSLFETDNKAKKNISLNLNGSVCSLFKYFLDGSRRVYKIFDFGSSDGKFLPIVAGQIGAAVCYRDKGKMKKQKIIVTTYPNHANTTRRCANKSRSVANTFSPCLRNVEIIACKRAYLRAPA